MEHDEEAKVIAKCMGCGMTREIEPGEVPLGEMPMCECGDIMLPQAAEIKQGEL